jgi:DNA-binding MarR family transcriptional regulator
MKSSTRPTIPAPLPKQKKMYLTEGMDPATHISYQVTIIANLMAFGNSPANCKQFGLNIREWRVMGFIAPLGPQTASQLVDMIHQDKANISRAIAELSQKGLIVKLPNKSHKRSPFIWLSKNGMALYKKIEPVHDLQADLFTDCLSQKEKLILCGFLDKIKLNAEQVKRVEGLE